MKSGRYTENMVYSRKISLSVTDAKLMIYLNGVWIGDLVFDTKA